MRYHLTLILFLAVSSLWAQRSVRHELPLPSLKQGEVLVMEPMEFWGEPNSASELDAPFFTMALVWQGSSTLPPATQFRYREGSAGWMPWENLQPDPHGQLANGDVASQLITLPPATTHIQIRLEKKLDEVWPEELIIDAYAPLKGLSRPAPPTVIRTEEDCCDRPDYQTRADWGCPDGQQAPGWWPGYYRVSHLVVHHTATSAVAPYESLVSSIWNYHTNTLGWGDIGYNWLIAPDGTLFEGRAGGNHAAGGHMCARNSYTMGIGMLGDFTNELPTDTAQATLEKLLAYMSCISFIDPLDSSLHVRSGLYLPHIIGHRDGCNPGYTECPGAQFYPTLPAVRTSVKSRLDSCGNPGPEVGDLFITSRSIAQSSVMDGDSVGVDLTVEVVGKDTAQYLFEYGLFLSDDIVWDTSDVQVGAGPISLTGSIGEITWSDFATIPAGTSPGSYYLLFVADWENMVEENDERNNVVFRPLSVTENSTANLFVPNAVSFSAFPNPFSDEIEIRSGLFGESAQWELSDPVGRLLARGTLTFQAGEGKLMIPTEIPTGVLFLKIWNADASGVLTLIRQ